MKKEKSIKKIYSFHSISSPQDFIARVEDEALNSNLKIEQVEKGFNLQIGSNHGGEVIYKATIVEDENGGSFIRGEFVTAPCNIKPEKKKNIFQKILSILVFIMILPFILLCVICAGLYELFICILHGKSYEQSNEQKLCNFMVNRMCCKQENEI